MYQKAKNLNENKLIFELVHLISLIMTVHTMKFKIKFIMIFFPILDSYGIILVKSILRAVKPRVPIW